MRPFDLFAVFRVFTPRSPVGAGVIIPAGFERFFVRKADNSGWEPFQVRKADDSGWEDFQVRTHG